MTAIRSAWPDHPGYAIDLVPCIGIARVVASGVVLAESRRALRLIETDHVERLYFPESDVRTDLLEPSDHHSVCPFKGQASYWSYRDSSVTVDNLFWYYPEPFPQVAGIEGFLGVYHERATVEVVTEWPDGAASTVGFPAWGDVSDLLRLLDSVPSGQGRFVAPGYHVRERNVVEGGQLLGQAIVAACRTVPNQRVTSASMNFTRAADFDDPVELSVEEIRKGRTFSTLSVRSQQRGKLVAPALILMDSGAPDTIRASETMPDVKGPEDSEPFDMGVAGRALRVVDGAYSSDPDRIGPPVIHAWMRLRDDPGEAALRQAMLAQATTHWTIAAGLLPHPGLGQAQAHVSLSTGPMAISLAFHDEGRLDDWFLYSTTAIWSGRGLVQGEGRIWTRGGVLLASYSLQAMVRGLLAGAGGRDASSAM